MDAHLLDFLALLVRWLHVIAGIASIGSSFYFIWLDNSLEAPRPGSEAAGKGVAGELWAVHGGGFYNPQNTPSLPLRSRKNYIGSSGRPTPLGCREPRSSCWSTGCTLNP
jgi:uncharacterized membrane protein